MIDAASLGSILAFWVTVAACGLLAWPFASLLFPNDTDRGYLAAKPIGWVIGAYAAWLAGVAGIPFAQYGWAVGIAALFALFALALRQARTSLLAVNPLRIAQWELGFLLLLVTGTVIKMRFPDIQGLEKFMDFAFVNASLRAEAMPPADPWWAGEPINYYYFGHTAAAWLIQLSRVPADHGFNLMMGLIFTFVASGSYRIVEGVLASGNRRVAVVCGGIAGTLVTVGGNSHSVIYGPFRAFSPTTYDRGYYYPDSTRFVGFDPPTLDHGFTEMPGYGFAVGDLHAHVLNLPVAFLLILLLVRILQREWSERSIGGVRLIEVAILGLLFGVTAMCNSWDALSYGILMGMVGLLLLVRTGFRAWRRMLLLVAAAFAVVLTGVLVALPFLLQFKQIANGVVWGNGQTPLWQLAVLYGHGVGPALVLFAGALFWGRRDPRWMVGAVLAALALALIAVPEILYIKDIYGDDHRRANTMFKLTFQAQPVAFLAGCVVVGLLLQSARWWRAALGMVLAVPMLATLSYAGEIYGDSFRTLDRTRFTLDGFGFIDRQWPGDRALLDWLRELPPRAPVKLVEVAGDSFTNTGRLSAMSGVPALLGWRGHEWLWRGDGTTPFRRADAIAAFYEDADLADACSFVKANGVTHVAIGGLEREMFPALAEATLQKLGPIIVQSGSSLLIAVDLSNCQSS